MASSRNTGRAWYWRYVLCSCLLLGSLLAAGLRAESPPEPPQSGLSLADQVAEVVVKYPEVRPLLERILSRLDTALLMLKTPLPELLGKLEQSATIIGRQEQRLQAQDLLLEKLQAELTASKVSQEKSEAAWRQERGELIARIQAEQGMRIQAERDRDAAIWANVGQGILNIGQGLAHIFR